MDNILMLISHFFLWYVSLEIELNCTEVRLCWCKEGRTERRCLDYRHTGTWVNSELLGTALSSGISHHCNSLVNWLYLLRMARLPLSSVSVGKEQNFPSFPGGIIHPRSLTHRHTYAPKYHKGKHSLLSSVFPAQWSQIVWNLLCFYYCSL